LSTIAVNCHYGVKINLSRGYLEVFEHGVHCIPEVDEVTVLACTPLDTVTDSPLNPEPSEVDTAPVFTELDPARLSKNRIIRCQGGLDNREQPNQQAGEDYSNVSGNISGDKTLTGYQCCGSSLA
jgi:hypothetical protein